MIVKRSALEKLAWSGYTLVDRKNVAFYTDESRCKKFSKTPISCMNESVQLRMIKAVLQNARK